MKKSKRLVRKTPKVSTRNRWLTPAIVLVVGLGIAFSLFRSFPILSNFFTSPAINIVGSGDGTTTVKPKKTPVPDSGSGVMANYKYNLTQSAAGVVPANLLKNAKILNPGKSDEEVKIVVKAEAQATLVELAKTDPVLKKSLDSNPNQNQEGLTPEIKAAAKLKAEADTAKILEDQKKIDELAALRAATVAQDQGSGNSTAGDTCGTNGSPVQVGTWVSTGAPLGADGQHCDDGASCPERQCVKCVGKDKFEGSEKCSTIFDSDQPLVLPAGGGKPYTGYDMSISSCVAKQDGTWLLMGVGQRSGENTCTPDGNMTPKDQAQTKFDEIICISKITGQVYRDGKCQNNTSDEQKCREQMKTNKNLQWDGGACKPMNAGAVIPPTGLGLSKTNPLPCSQLKSCKPGQGQLYQLAGNLCYCNANVIVTCTPSVSADKKTYTTCGGSDNRTIIIRTCPAGQIYDNIAKTCVTGVAPVAPVIAPPPGNCGTMVCAGKKTPIAGSGNMCTCDMSQVLAPVNYGNNPASQPSIAAGTTISIYTGSSAARDCTAKQDINTDCIPGQVVDGYTSYTLVSNPSTGRPVNDNISTTPFTILKDFTADQYLNPGEKCQTKSGCQSKCKDSVITTYKVNVSEVNPVTQYMCGDATTVSTILKDKKILDFAVIGDNISDHTLKAGEECGRLFTTKCKVQCQGGYSSIDYTPDDTLYGYFSGFRYVCGNGSELKTINSSIPAANTPLSDNEEKLDTTIIYKDISGGKSAVQQCLDASEGNKSYNCVETNIVENNHMTWRLVESP